MTKLFYRGTWAAKRRIRRKNCGKFPAWLVIWLASCLGIAFLIGCGDQTNLMPLSGLEYEPSLAPPGIISSGTYATGSGTTVVASPTTTVTPSSSASGTFDLSGSVFDSETVSPVQNVLAILVGEVTASGTVRQITVSPEKTTLTSTNGKYHFSNVAPGYHVISFYKDDYEKYSLEAELSSSGQLLTPLDILMRRSTYTLRGIVNRKVQIGDQIKTEPIEGVELTLKEIASLSATTPTSGEFIFPGLKSGFYTLIAEKPGVFAKMSTSVEIKKGFEPDSVELTLSPSTFSIQGKVSLNLTGEPLRNIRIDLYDRDNSPLAWTLTTDEGLFSFQNLSVGLQSLSAQGTGYYTATSVIQVFDDGTISPASPQISLTRIPGNLTIASISGTVLDAYTDRPIEFANVSLQGYYTLLTDRYGYFSFGFVPPGEYQLELKKEGFNLYKRNFTVQVDGKIFPTDNSFYMIYQQEEGLGSIVGRYVPPPSVASGQYWAKLYQISHTEAKKEDPNLEWEINPTPVKIAQTTNVSTATGKNNYGIFKFTHLPSTPTDNPGRYLVFVGSLETSQPNYYVASKTELFPLTLPDQLWQRYPIKVASNTTYFVSNQEN